MKLNTSKTKYNKVKKQQDLFYTKTIPAVQKLVFRRELRKVVPTETTRKKARLQTAEIALDVIITKFTKQT